MLIRALIVLLLVLNLGVALWWAMRTPPSNPPPAESTPGVARLQLLSERSPDAVAAPEAPTVVAISQCVSFGPFADAAEANGAQSRLQPLVAKAQPRREYAGTAHSWKVLLVPFASIDQAEDAARRIDEAGFTDYFVVRDGDDAGSVALGLYRNETAARERVATLIAAGFPVELEPLGAGPAEHWLDIGAASRFDPARAQLLVEAARIEPIDCERFSPDPPADPQPEPDQRPGAPVSAR